MFKRIYRYLFGKKEEPPPIPPRPPQKIQPKSLIQQVIEFKKMGFSTICKNYQGKYGKGWMMGCNDFCILLYEHAPMDWHPRFLPMSELEFNGIFCRMEPKQLF